MHMLRNKISAFNTALTCVTYKHRRYATNVSYTWSIFYPSRGNMNMKLCYMNSFMYLQSA